jgi:hypothetical protein
VGDAGDFGEFDGGWARPGRVAAAPEFEVVDGAGVAFGSLSGEEEVGDVAACDSASFCFLGGMTVAEAADFLPQKRAFYHRRERFYDTPAENCRADVARCVRQRTPRAPAQLHSEPLFG